MNLLNLKRLIALAELQGATNASKVYVDAYGCINVVTPLGEIATVEGEEALHARHIIPLSKEVSPTLHPDKLS